MASRDDRVEFALGLLALGYREQYLVKRVREKYQLDPGEAQADVTLALRRIDEITVDKRNLRKRLYLSLQQILSTAGEPRDMIKTIELLVKLFGLALPEESEAVPDDIKVVIPDWRKAFKELETKGHIVSAKKNGQGGRQKESRGPQYDGKRE